MSLRAEGAHSGPQSAVGPPLVSGAILRIGPQASRVDLDAIDDRREGQGRPARARYERGGQHRATHPPSGGSSNHGDGNERR